MELEDVDLQKELEAAGETAEEQVEQAEPAKPEPEVKDTKQIPLASLLEERNEWKRERDELRKQLAEVQTSNKTGTERLEKLFKALETKDEKPVPQFVEDPLGNLRHTAEATAEEISRLREWKTSLETQNKQQEEFRRFQQSVASAEQKFAQSTPEYWEAAQFVAKTQREHLELLGVPNDQIEHALFRQLAGLAANAVQNGKDPAQVTYELAKKYGFSKKQDLSTLQKGVEASRTVPSGKEDVPASIETLASLSDEDFDKLVDDPKAWKRLLSG